MAEVLTISRHLQQNQCTYCRAKYMGMGGGSEKKLWCRRRKIWENDQRMIKRSKELIRKIPLNFCCCLQSCKRYTSLQNISSLEIPAETNSNRFKHQIEHQFYESEKKDLEIQCKPLSAVWKTPYWISFTRVLFVSLNMVQKNSISVAERYKLSLWQQREPMRTVFWKFLNRVLMKQRMCSERIKIFVIKRELGEIKQKHWNGWSLSFTQRWFGFCKLINNLYNPQKKAALKFSIAKRQKHIA